MREFRKKIADLIKKFGYSTNPDDILALFAPTPGELISDEEIKQAWKDCYDSFPVREGDFPLVFARTVRSRQSRHDAALNQTKLIQLFMAIEDKSRHESLGRVLFNPKGKWYQRIKSQISQ